MTEKACTECGAVFFARARTDRYCSKTCRGRHDSRTYKQRYPERVAEQRRAYYLANPDKHGWTEAKKAAYKRRRAKTKGAGVVEVFHDAEIFERDRWVCGICHKPVKSALIYPDPRSASLDHIVPLALGGQHERSNVQLAHLECNTKKRTRTGPTGDQLRLVG